MSRLEDLVHEALSTHAAEAPDGATLLSNVHSRATHRRRRRIGWTAIGLIATAGVAVVVMLVVILPAGHSDPAPGRVAIVSSPAASYPLPSDGWKPGDPGFDALTFGPLHASRRGDQVCAWLGATYRPMLWPEGYSVRLNPVELIGPNGAVIAREGQTLAVGGGGNPAKAGTPCARTGQETFYVNGTPTTRRP
jgi:hypothetical protein